MSLSYNRCSRGELKRFVRQRGLVPDNRPRQMIRTLRKADRQATFRLLDLPRELRDRIYHYAFQVEEIDTGRLPSVQGKLEIFRSCKQVHKEASDLFFGEQVFHLGIFLRCMRPRLFIHYNGDYLDDDKKRTRDEVIPWPEWLKRIRCLKIRILIAVPGFAATQKEHDDDIELFNDALHQLCGFLTSDTINIRRLQVEIQVDVHIDEKRLRDILSPIPAIAARAKSTEFSFIGVPDSLKISIAEATKGFRALYLLENESSLSGLGTSKLQSGGLAENFKMNRITEVIVPELEDGLFIYANDHVLRTATSEFESDVADPSNTKVDSLLSDLNRVCLD